MTATEVRGFGQRLREHEGGQELDGPGPRA